MNHIPPPDKGDLRIEKLTQPPSISPEELKTESTARDQLQPQDQRESGETRSITTSDIPKLPEPRKTEQLPTGSFLRTITPEAAERVASNLTTLLNPQSINLSDQTCYPFDAQAINRKNFDQELTKAAKEKDLTPSQVAEMRVAHYHPELVKPNALLKEVETRAMELTEEEIPTPEGQQPQRENADSFDAEVSRSYDTAYETALNTYAKDHPELTKKDLDAIRYMHAHPEAKFPPSANTEKLQNLNKTFEQMALKQIQEQYRIQANFPFLVDKASIDGLFNGFFLHFVDEKMSTIPAFKPGKKLTNNEFNLLLKAIKNPNDTSIPTEIKELALKAMEQMNRKFILPVGWSPTITPDFYNNIEVGENALDFALEAVEIIEEYVQDPTLAGAGAPGGPAGGPETKVTLSTLSLVTQALLRLQEILYETGEISAIINKLASDTRHQISMAQLDERSKKNKEMEEKQAKMEPLNKFMSIFGPIGKAIAVIVAVIAAVATGGALAWLAVGIAVLMVVDSIVAAASPQKMSMFEMLFKEIDKGLANITPQAAKDFLSVFCKAIVITALVAASGGQVPVLLDVLSTTLGSSKVIQDLMRAFGANKDVQDWVAFAVPLVIGIGAIAVSAAKAGKIVQDTVSKLEKVGNLFLRPMQSVMGVTQSGTGAALSIYRGQLVQIRSKSEAQDEEYEALLEVLIKAIQNSLNKIPEVNEKAADLGKQISTNIRQHAAAMSNIAG